MKLRAKLENSFLLVPVQNNFKMFKSREIKLQHFFFNMNEESNLQTTSHVNIVNFKGAKLTQFISSYDI